MSHKEEDLNTSSDWKTRKVSLSWLRMRATSLNGLDSAMAFLKEVGVVPREVEWRRRNRLPSVNTPADAIPAQYLAEVALDWDDMGPSKPSEFVHALSFEVAGTPQRDAVAEVLSALGSSTQEAALAA